MPLSDFRCVETPRSLNFFAQSAEHIITPDLMDELFRASVLHGNCNTRICLHQSPEDEFHQMIVLEWIGSYFPPHRHKKVESLQIIRGSLAIATFEDDGTVRRFATLSEHGLVSSYIGPGTWHFTTPTSAMVVYSETKRGPFLGDADREFAPWAPAIGEDHQAFFNKLGL